MQFEGEAPPERTVEDSAAIKAWNLLHNGYGGIDWAGLDTVVELLGIADVELLITRLLTIKLHKPPKVAQQE